MVNRLLQIALGLPALAFIALGFVWWVVPDVAGKQLGMDLLTGAGLSTQIADLASFFLTLGICMLMGLATGRRLWLYPAVMLLGIAIIGRIIAWLLHGADLTIGMIGVEVVVIALLLAASRTMKRA